MENPAVRGNNLILPRLEEISRREQFGSVCSFVCPALPYWGAQR